MQLYSPVDLTGNLILIEKLVSETDPGLAGGRG